MRPTGGFALALLAVSVCMPAEAATVRLLDRARTTEVSPQVAHNSHFDNFVVVAASKFELRSGRTGLSGNGNGPWTRSSNVLGRDWGEKAFLSYNPRARAFLVAGSSREYFRLNRKGRVQTRHDLGGESPRAIAATWIAGTPNWFVFVEDCPKYGCSYSGQIIGPRGDLLRTFDLYIPTMDRFLQLGRKWQVAYDRDTQTFLMLFEDGLDSTRGGPSRAIMVQRFREDGSLVGNPIEIASHPKDASAPHMVYHRERREWLIVYRRGFTVQGRFLRGDRVSGRIRIGDLRRKGAFPSIAYSPWRDSYLVTWVQEGKGAGIYGRWMRSDGRMVGGWFVVNDPGDDQFVFAPGNSVCNDTGACLVTWVNDGEGGTVRGQYLRVP